MTTNAIALIKHLESTMKIARNYWGAGLSETLTTETF